MNARYRVSRGWAVTAPGGRQWTGAPSQPAAFQLAQSLAGIDEMLARINRPKLTVVRKFGLELTLESFDRLGAALDRVADAERRAYGFHRMPPRAAQ